jgi:hypothetical protein
MRRIDEIRSPERRLRLGADVLRGSGRELRQLIELERLDHYASGRDGVMNQHDDADDGRKQGDDDVKSGPQPQGEQAWVPRSVGKAFTDLDPSPLDVPAMIRDAICVSNELAAGRDGTSTYRQSNAAFRARRFTTPVDSSCAGTPCSGGHVQDS